MTDSAASDLAASLVGAWRLERWELVYEDGRPAECPLGEDAQGLLMYTADGHVSASLARASRPPLDAADPASKAQAFDGFFGYAGRYSLHGDALIHRIAIASHPALVGVDSLRNVRLEGDRLILAGPDFSPGAPRSHRIVWRRP